MQNIKPTLWLLLGLASFPIQSCNDEKEQTCVAGSGGSVNLVLFPQHHGEAIPGIVGYSDSAFIKFNTRDFPGEDPSKYDLVLTGDVGSDSILVPSLKCGDYFLFMTGFDTSIAERVKGGIPYSISEGASGVRNVVVPVTEN